MESEKGLGWDLSGSCLDISLQIERKLIQRERMLNAGTCVARLRNAADPLE